MSGIRRGRAVRIAFGIAVLIAVAGGIAVGQGGSSTPAQAQGPVGSQAHAMAKGAVSGLPVPRFVSLKSDKVNVRRGPARDQDVTWIYSRAGLPVEITAEWDNWRRIRDAEGGEGWVYHSLLSGRRTALVAPWHQGEPLKLHRRADAESPVVAMLEPRVMATVGECSGQWCHISGPRFDGYISQDRLFGVYPGERFD